MCLHSFTVYVLLACLLSNPVFAELVVEDLSSPSITPNILAKHIVGQGIQISNVRYQGNIAAAGLFSDAEKVLGFDNGIILGSGKVSDVVGTNKASEVTTQHRVEGDKQLNEIADKATYDAAILEFDFVPSDEGVLFRYVFASDEYHAYANSEVNDSFAFFINGQNCATYHGIPITINTINGGNPLGTNAQNSHLFIDNTMADANQQRQTEMDGLTVVLSCAALVKHGQRNHLKLAIADAGDDKVDSNVFIEAASLKSVPKSEIQEVLRQQSSLDIGWSGIAWEQIAKWIFIGILLLLAIIFIVLGFIIPSRFSPHLGVMLSPEEDMSEGFLHRIRSQPGTNAGFYRDAKVYIGLNFKLSNKPSGALACLHARGKKIEIQGVAGHQLYRQTVDASWERLDTKPTTLKLSTLYKDENGTLFFELRNKII